MVRFLPPLLGFALALALRLATLDRREPWLDEALTQFALSLDWSGLIADRLAAGHSPFYFLTLKATGLDPAQILPLRAVSAILDATACAVFGATVQRIAGLRAALFGMALYAASPVLIGWGQNARPYGLMMLCLAIGLYGAAGLLSPSRWRGDAPAFAVGLAGAAVTLSAGAIAALLVVLSPLALPARRTQQGRWARASLLPLAGIATMAAVVTLPAIRKLAPAYWTERVASFGYDSLASLVRGLVIGDRLSRDEAQWVLGTVPWQLATAAAAVVLGLAMARALRDRPRSPALLPFAILALAYPALLVLLSLATSLLIPRYFLPALGPALMLAGIGLSRLAARPAGALLAAAVLAGFAMLTLHHALAKGVQRNPAPRLLADIALTDTAPGTRLFRLPGDWVGFDTMAEILPRALGPDPNPRVIEAPVEAVRGAIGSGPVFLALHRDQWQANQGRALPRPDCLWSEGPAVLVYWGGVRRDCPPRALSE